MYIIHVWTSKPAGSEDGRSHKLEGTISTSTIVRGGEEWNLIAERESYDMMLYYYALELFAKQASTIFQQPYVDSNGKIIHFAATEEGKWNV